ncbi:MAG: cell division protein FtsX [Bacteroidales bacterium]|nr:cell division protein FtsX [Bacteroidales bacterium]MCB8998723.1 cell division protein FtsX [Bacteroidales bacterium]
MSIQENQVVKKRLTSSYLTTVISISLVLFLLGIVGFLILNVQNLSRHVKENIGFNVELKDNVREADIQQFRKILDSKKYVKSTEYVSKEQAAAETQKALGEDFITFLGFNPLPASIKVKLNAPWANPDSIAVIQSELKKYPELSEMYYRKTLIHEINDNVKKISLIIFSFTLLLLLIALTLINNTIRLSVYSKRFLIHTMQLVGATRGFIRKPFIFKGVYYGILSALIAIILLLGTIYVVQNQIEGLVEFVDPKILALLFASVLGTGILISAVSTFFAVNKYLNLNTDALYL